MTEAPPCYGLGNQLDIEHIRLKAQRRWLRPHEICAILRNYSRFRVSAKPPNMPSSGSFLLYNRKVQRNYRKDGHKWRNKKEGHETLQVGTPNALKCYYAHGEENQKFQRRCYWMVGKELSHIVFVHYRDVTGNTSNSVNENEAGASHSLGIGENTANYQMQSPVSSIFSSNNCLATGTSSPNSATHQLKDLRDVDESHLHSSSPINGERVEHENGVGVSGLPFQGNTNTSMLGPSSLPQHQLISIIDFSPDWAYANSETKVLIVGRFLTSPDVIKNCRWSCIFGKVEVQAEVIADNVLRCYTPRHEAGRVSFCVKCSNRSACSEVIQFEFRIGHVEYSGRASKSLDSESWEDIFLKGSIDMESTQTDPTGQVLDDKLHEKQDSREKLPLKKVLTLTDIRNHLLDGSSSEDGLKKLDSFNSWTSKEHEDVLDVDELHVKSSHRADMGTVVNGNLIFSNLPEGKTNFMPGPSLSQDEFFSIVDFSPKWADVGSETEVRISGKLLKSPDLLQNFKWSCMFGEEEVPAEVVADGVLCCRTLKHEAGWVPFYITCSNRLACSKVQKFEYRASHSDDMNTADDYNSTSQNLILRFGELLSVSSYFTGSSTSSFDEISSKINSLLMDGTLEWDSVEERGPSGKEELHQKRLKEMLRIWLLQKAAEDGKGPSVLDKGGQGVLHFAAALGYDWAFEPTIIAGVNVNFRDANGWSALHWAASCGRERAVVSLMSLGADPGAVTVPSPNHPLGRSPADLASDNGHKGIAGYLGEFSLSSVLKGLTLDSREGIAAGPNAPKDFSFSFGIGSDGQSVEVPLAVVRYATQAYSHICQHYRVKSFREKQSKEYGADKFGMSDDRALKLVAAKSNKRGQKDEPVHVAAIRVQNKFRSWKGRREFIAIREQVVKIQAHIRGYIVRKHYRKILWTFGLVEKAILRWRRKGSGLCGLKRGTHAQDPNILEITSKDNDDDFLKQGRKQAEERMQKALSRVMSMVQYPEGRDQYLRLLNAANEIQAKKANFPGPSNFDENLLDIEASLEDDNFMFQAP